MRAGRRIRRWRIGAVLFLGLVPMSGCGAGRNAEYSYEPWDVQATGTAGPAGDATGGEALAAGPGAAATSTTGGPAIDPETDVQALRAQVRELREREQTLLHALDSARTAPARPSPAAPQDSPASPAPDLAATGAPPAPAPEDTQVLADRIATLHAELAEERRRRQAAEMQLERLRQETSQPPFGTATVPESALLSAKQEIVYLRQALAEEKSARQRLADDFGALQRELARRPAQDAPATQERSAQLENRQGEAAASFQRTMAATEAESAALDRELASAAAGADDDVSAVRAQNTLLRQHLDEQRKRTQDLAAKLKLATRVTDLIFKLESQSSSSSVSPARKARMTPVRTARPRRPAAPPAAAAPPDTPPAPAPAKAPVPQQTAPKPRRNTGDAPYPT